MGQVDFLTPTQLVGRWGGAVKLGTLANWRAQGKGPAFVKVGARVIYKVEAIEAWEAQQKNGGAE